MNEIDFTIISSQLGVAKQSLDSYRMIKQNKYHENDETKQLHDAIQALEIALRSLASQIEASTD